VVSVYLLDYVYDEGESVPEDTGVKEWLNNYLEQGWRVIQMIPLFGGAEGGQSCGWIIVLLEKD
jgi:hypothetical protein